MRKYFVILLSLTALLLFSSKSCETPENNKEDETTLESTMDSINKTFLAENLSDQTLQAFEMKAEQKLTDFGDYLQIYSDKSLDEAFRTHVRQMIRELFISDSVRINIRITKDKNEKDLTINEFLGILSSGDDHSIRIFFDSIEVNNPLQRTGVIKYAGSLKFIQRYEVSPSINPAITGSVCRKVDIFAVKGGKQFGGDTLQIWQVYLGSIR
jgi:hypothetical protein